MGRHSFATGRALLFGTAAGAAAVCGGPQALAQSSQPPAPAANEDQVDDIVVTARKRAENLRDVPVSITAIGGEDLTSAKITQVVDLASRVPNLVVTSGANLPFSLIRGFGSGNNLSFDQAVGKFVDNVSYGRDQDIRLPLFDIERVEVLKGPQVLLYGNSSTAGALNITTRKPAAEFAANGSAAYDFVANEVVVEGGLTAPLSEGVGLRLSGMYQDRARGITQNLLTGDREPGIKNYAVRAVFRAAPSPDLSFTLKGEFDHLRERGTGGELSYQTPGGPTFPDGELDSRNAVDNDVAPFFQKAFNALNNTTIQGDIQYDLGSGILSSTSAYRDLKFGQSTPSPVPLLNAYLGYRYKQFSQEIRYAASLDRLNFTIGAYLQHDTFLVTSAIDFNLAAVGAPLPPFALNGALDQTHNSYSIFADGTYNLADGLSLELGGRYTWIRKSADQSLVPGDVVPAKGFNTQGEALSPNPAFTGLFLFGTGVPPHSFTGLKLRESFFQPQAVLQFKVSPKDQVYLKYVRGTKAGGFDYFYTGAPPAGPTTAGAQFAPEKASSFEAGFKGLAFDNRLGFSFAAFPTTFTDLQASSFQTASFVVSNVGKARTQGVEFDMTYAPVAGLRIASSGAYLDAKYLDYTGQPCTVDGVGCVGGSQNLSGTRTPFASKWTGTLSIDYEHSLGEKLALAGGAALYARSSYNASTNNEPRNRQDGYAQIDAHLDLKAIDGNWVLSFFARNLTDKKVLEFGGPTPGFPGSLFGYRSRGRQLGMRVGFGF